MPGIDAQACGAGTLRSPGKQRERRVRMTVRMRLRVRAGIQLDAVCTEHRRLSDIRMTGIDE